MDERISAIACCPRCRSPLSPEGELRCANAACAYHTEGFATVGGKPVLIDFADSIIDRDKLVGAGGSPTLSRSRTPLRWLRDWAAGANHEAGKNCPVFLDRLRAFPAPRVLIVGGGARGGGTEALYAAADVERVGTDIYLSPDVDVLADGHRLPFADGSFQGLWIQAVLEHVVSPHVVVAEAHRVLAPGGIIYAETPFMQAVHERAYDFTRFSRSGHRWLFRGFDEVRSGTIGGPAESLLWAIRYVARGLFRSDKVGSLATVVFFWVRFLDKFVDERYRADAATGVFFLGVKAERAMNPSELLAYFPGVRGI